MSNNTNYNFNQEDILFALDVGTRTIVGMVCVPEGENLRVIDVEIRDQPERSMIDGQIHDIAKVAGTVIQVKETLEKKLQTELTHVSIAAAGRSLKTVQVTIEQKINPEERILPEEITAMEMEGVNKAQEELQISDNISPKDFYCVGYTSVQYMLDDMAISSLISQKGKCMSVTILTTFLPYAVVESLLTVINQAGLTLHSMTLEPIAAIQALIPHEYRMLNLALIDLGAGTSDIAITREGSVIAYAMVPMAGDEITETLAQHFLLDFRTADELKKDLTSGKAKLSFKDIIGNSMEVSREELLKIIAPIQENIVKKICDSILFYNKKAPKAIFCVGGSSQLPLLREMIVKNLDVPIERVAIRDFNALKRFIYYGDELRGPDCITPMGIALSALNEKYFGFSYVTVNSKVIRLMETEPVNVGKVLLIAGFNPRSLIGLRGQSTRITVNGRKKFFTGQPGENAIIRLNGEDANLETIVKPNDEIKVEPAIPGQPVAINVSDVMNLDEDYFVYLRGSRIKIPPAITVNGRPAAPEKSLNNGDVIEITVGTIEDFANMADIEMPERLTINGEMATMSRKLYPGDRIDYESTNYIQ